MELQWGERCRGAFGTYTRIAGSFSISVWPVLLPSVGNCQYLPSVVVNPDLAQFRISEERGAGWE
jgi:hypothetical protein